MSGFDTFGKQAEPEEFPQEDECFLALELNAKLQPLHRGDIYEDPLAAAMETAGCGAVDGGGTLLQENGEVALCDIAICLHGNTEENMNCLLNIIQAMEMPKGSFLRGENVEIPLGTLEGLALYLNGTELPEEVYKTSDVNYVIARCNELLAESGSLYSWWQGPKDTALYFYGPSFAEMKKKIADFIAEYPLCQKSRVEQIA